jgi:hypothetical protein
LKDKQFLIFISFNRFYRFFGGSWLENLRDKVLNPAYAADRQDSGPDPSILQLISREKYKNTNDRNYIAIER